MQSIDVFRLCKPVYKKIIYLFILFLYLPAFPLLAEVVESGLHINAHTHLAENRTSLCLEKRIELKDEMTLSFDMMIRKEKDYFGFVFRMISDKNENIDLLFSLDRQYQPFPELIVGDNTYPVNEKLELEKWLPVEIKLSKKQGKIWFTYDNFTFELSHSFEKTGELYISFGKCTHSKFTSTDVAPVNIKNVKIYEGRRIIRHWELNKHQGNNCYDLINGKIATAQYPSWRIDDHWKWREVSVSQIDNSSQFAFDAKEEILYIVPDEKKVIAFDVNTLQEKTIPVKAGYPAACNFSQLIVDTINNRLVSFNIDKEKVSFFSFADNTWSQKEKEASESAYWHHTSLFSGSDTSVYTFGGYGGYKYNNVLVHFYPEGNKWQKQTVGNIFPRYSAASAIVGNDLYIFGGRGSKTGRQELATQYAYDLYKINIESGKTTFVGDFALENVTYLPAENMIFNADDSCFYVLGDWEGGRLIKLSLKEKKASVIGDAIPGVMSSLHLYRNLFYSPAKSKLYAVYDKKPKNSIKTLAVYSMKYPPLTKEDTVQPPVEVRHYGYCMAGGVILLLFVGGMVWIVRFRKKRKGATAVLSAAGSGEETGRDLKEVVGTASKEATEAVEAEKKRCQTDNTGSCICLLGGFCVRNREGENITATFSPILRSLLLMLILHSNSEKKGIISSRLDETLWGDKDENSARNNRNVSIRKLRLILENIGDVSISTSNNYWKISCGDSVFCDYRELMAYLHRPSLLEDKKEFSRFLELSCRGALLPNIQLEWIDGFKSDLSSGLIDILLKFAGKEMYKSNQELILKIADAIFANDSLNEEALRLKCVALFTNGKVGIAKNTYDSFCREYQALLDTPYQKSFNHIIEENTV